MSYIIKWKSRITEDTGQGTYAGSKEEMRKMVEELNKEWEELYHWIEPLENTIQI